MNRRTLILALAFPLFCPYLFAQSNPVDQTEILGRLALEYSPSYIAHLVKTRGVGFDFSASLLERVKLAGGAGILVDRIATARSPSVTSSAGADVPVDHLAKCAELIHTGDVESADKECRASIAENPKSPWPLLATARLSRLGSQDTSVNGMESPDVISPEAEKAKEGGIRDLLERAALLAPNLAAVHGALASVQAQVPPGAASEWQKIQSMDPDGLEAGEGGVWYTQGDSWPFANFPGEDSSDALPPINEPITISTETLRRMQIEPDLASNHLDLASQYDNQAHDFDRAQSEYQEAIRLEPDNADIHMRLAVLCHTFHHKEASLAELRETVRIVPFGIPQHMALASELDTLGRTPEAIAELQTIIAIRPASIGPSGALIEIYIRQKDPKSAIDELRRSLKAASLAFTDEAKFVESRRYDEEQLADLLHNNHELDAAAEQYLYLLRFRPDDADLHNDYGNVLGDQHRIDEAIGEYTEALRLSPKMYVAHNNLGLCLAQKKNLDAALAEFRESVDIDPNVPYSRLLLGGALGAKGDLKSAMDQFHQVLEKDPKDADAHAGVGFALLQLKDTAGAIPELKRSLELQPDNPAAENNLAWIYATADDVKLRNPSEALVLARRAVESSPEPNPAFIDTLAEALLLNGHPAEALATETQAAGLDPGNSELQSRLAHFREAASIAKSSRP